MKKKEILINKVKKLRERYTNKVRYFIYFNNYLHYAKEAVKQHGLPYEDKYIGQEEAYEIALLEYKQYRFIVKHESEELKILKYSIRELDRQIRFADILKW